MEDRFSRTAALIGGEAMEKLRAARVAVFGLGGVGSYIAEALARAGIGSLLLIDGDAVAPSNMNRQLIATMDTVGMRKTDAAARRIAQIAPDCRVECRDVFYLPQTADAVSFAGLQYAADAVDTVAAKLLIIERAQAAGVPVISCMGTGNKLHPELFRIADMEQTSVCPLARVMRRELRVRGIRGVKALYSTEEPVTRGILPGEGAGRRIIPASISFVPGTAGLMIAGEIIRDIAGISAEEKREV